MTARAPMKPQTLKIPTPAPWINANARDHWTKKGRLTRSWRSASAAWARHQKLRPVTQPVVIVATVVKTNFSPVRRREPCPDREGRDRWAQGLRGAA
jgi:hypothetical protein